MPIAPRFRKKISRIQQSDFNRRMAICDGEAGWLPRVYISKPTRRRSAKMLIKCGCCDQSVEVWHGDGRIEINGVSASQTQWRRILLPLFNDTRA